MNLTHTPGPWTAMPHATFGPEAKRFQVRGPDEAGPTAYFVCENARFANARLIAAAPELLEALKILRTQFGDYKDGDGAAKFHACNIADAAIAKAEGRSE